MAYRRTMRRRRNPTKEEHNYQLVKKLVDLDLFDEKYVRHIVDDYTKKYRRRDIIEYMLKLWRINSLTVTSFRDGGKLMSRWMASFDWRNENDVAIHNAFSYWRADFEHFVSQAFANNYRTVLAIQWKRQHPDILLRELREATEYDEERADASIITDEELFGDLILNCGGGWGWYALSTEEQQEEEARANKNCGRGADGTILLSLRQEVEGGLSSHLTAEYYIGDDGKNFEDYIVGMIGLIGELKGRSNSKPKEEYHPQILALLRSKYVLMYVGGGYKPESNFEWTDLSPRLRREVEQKTPWLLDPRLLLQQEQTTYAIISLLQRLLDDADEIHQVGDSFVVGKPFDFENAVRYVYLNSPNSSHKRWRGFDFFSAVDILNGKAEIPERNLGLADVRLDDTIALLRHGYRDLYRQLDALVDGVREHYDGDVDQDIPELEGILMCALQADEYAAQAYAYNSVMESLRSLFPFGFRDVSLRELVPQSGEYYLVIDDPLDILLNFRAMNVGEFPGSPNEESSEKIERFDASTDGMDDAAGADAFIECISSGDEIVKLVESLAALEAQDAEEEES